TLNQLTSSAKFPQVENQSQQFLPNDFNDTKIEVTLPVYNPSIKLNKQLKEELINTYKADEDIYKRELVMQIKQAYYQYLQAGKALNVYTNAIATVSENLRYNEKLVKNNAATKDAVLKAKAQLSQVQSSLIDAQQQQKNAAAYFNFLINQPLDEIIEQDSGILQQTDAGIVLSIDETSQREELAKIKSAEKVLQKNLQLSNTYKLPVLNAFYNVGFQGYGYKFNDNHFYQLAGLQLTWNIFKANDNKLKTKQTQTDIDAIQNQYADVQNRLRLQATTAYNNYSAALQSLSSKQAETESSREAFRVIDKKFKEGMALQIEWIDARTQMTNAEIQYSLKQLDVLNKAAELERATAAWKF
ncbi:MAG TPA: TolC family protein, partial [Chitinophagaceae bacterium]|nr:TolC family protein [Chitinophagaceae bacterium]